MQEVERSACECCGEPKGADFSCEAEQMLDSRLQFVKSEFSCEAEQGTEKARKVDLSDEICVASNLSRVLRAEQMTE